MRYMLYIYVCIYTIVFPIRGGMRRRELAVRVEAVHGENIKDNLSRKHWGHT